MNPETVAAISPPSSSWPALCLRRTKTPLKKLNQSIPFYYHQVASSPPLLGMISWLGLACTSHDDALIGQTQEMLVHEGSATTIPKWWSNIRFKAWQKCHPARPPDDMIVDIPVYIQLFSSYDESWRKDGRCIVVYYSSYHGPCQRRVAS